jgi:hypothetical protein
LTYRPTDLVLGKHPFGPVKLDSGYNQKSLTGG